MSGLPGVLQWFLTWLTGKPLEGQKPLIRRSNLSHLITAYLWLILGICITTYAQINYMYLLVPIGWLFTICGARKLIPTINHYCVHGDLLPLSIRKKYSWLHAYIANFSSSMLFLQDYATYRAEHLTHHKINVVASVVDPDMAFIWQLGFKSGMTKKQLWSVLIWNLFFPFSKLHWLFIKSRIKVTFCRSTWFRFIIQALTIYGIVYFGKVTSLQTVIISIVFPMTYLYHIASLLQFLSEHLWLQDVGSDGLLKKEENHNKELLFSRSKRITNARFCGEPFPNMESEALITKILKCTLWGIRMLFIHLPTRLFILYGDLAVHDWHHRCTFGSDWANAFYSRSVLAKKLENTDYPLTEVWGLKNVLNLVFINLEKMEPINPELIEKDGEEAVLGM